MSQGFAFQTYDKNKQIIAIINVNLLLSSSLFDMP